MTLDRWVPFRTEGAGIRCRLFGFSHAGGNATHYLPLRRLMPPELDFCPIELPGRSARLEEPPFTAMSALIDRLYHVLQPLMDVPFGFFGHSVGAWTAYEAARRLGSRDGRMAVHLFVSGRASPPGHARPPRQRSDDELLAVLDRFGATPTAIMQCPELIAALLPALRADLALAEAYAVDPVDVLACPITAFGGADDFAHAGSLESWRGFTCEPFRIRIFPGGHFYFSPAAQALAQEMIADLREHIGTQAAGATLPI
jgi:medium-chain acyl-[acyl-carrier-protein] hydrolase